MNIIFENYSEIPISESNIQQLYRELLQHSTKDGWHRGVYKKSPNHVVVFNLEGKRLGIVFETASPFETTLRMEALISWSKEAYEQKKLHPLLITAIFMVEFLAIHPFQDGNGRLSRILTTYLLLRSGYAYVPYSSLEAVIEGSKEGYYLTLRKTQGTLKSEHPSWQPWITFILKALRQHKQRLEVKLDREKFLMIRLPERSLQILDMAKSRGSVTLSEIVAFTNANRNTIKKQLENLVQNNYLQENGIGKATWYSAKA